MSGMATNNQKQSAKGLKEYEQVKESYEHATPAGERMAQKAQPSCKKDQYFQE